MGGISKRPGRSRRRGYQPRRATAGRKAHGAEVVRRLRLAYPEARCALHHRDAYELLVATILSAQCTDERVNMVTPAFFHRWPDPGSLAGADQAEVEDVVHSTGFFRNKAKNLVAMATRVRDVHGGEVPSDMESLLALGGVARKTANVVRGAVWGLADGVVVDTHVQRLAGLLGWTVANNAVHIEQDLMVLHPKADWIDVSHLLVFHGRNVCKARKPACGSCTLADVCPAATVA